MNFAFRRLGQELRHMPGRLLEFRALRRLGDLGFECLQIGSLLLEDHIWCTKRGKMVAQHAWSPSTDLADHAQQFLQFLLHLMCLARCGMKRETRYIHSSTPFRATHCCS